MLKLLAVCVNSYQPDLGCKDPSVNFTAQKAQLESFPGTIPAAKLCRQELIFSPRMHVTGRVI